jgi:hypothetical protein
VLGLQRPHEERGHDEHRAPPLQEAAQADHTLPFRGEAQRAADVAVAHLRGVQREEQAERGLDAHALAHGVRGGRVAHVFGAEERQRPAIHRDVLRGHQKVERQERGQQAGHVDRARRAALAAREKVAHALAHGDHHRAREQLAGHHP